MKCPDLKQLKTSNEQRIQILEEETKNLRNIHKAELNRLNQELERLRDENKKLMKHEEKTIRPLQSKINELEQTKYNYEQKIKELEKSLQDFKQKEMKLEDQEQTIQRLRAQLNQTKSNYVQQVNQLKKDICARDQLLSEKQESIQNEFVYIEETNIVFPEKSRQQENAWNKGTKKELALEKTAPRWHSFFDQFGYLKLFYSYLNTWFSWSNWKTWIQSWMSYWLFIAIVAMMGPPGAYFATRYMLKNPKRSIGQALWFLVPVIGFLVWLDLVLVARQRGHKRSEFILPLISVLPFMKASKDSTKTNVKGNEKNRKTGQQERNLLLQGNSQRKKRQ